MQTKTDQMRGWKCFDKDLKCRGHQFEVGKSYEVTGPVVMCENGWHFHHEPQHLFNYYANSTETRVCEIVAYDVIVGDDKAVCRRIEVVRELSFVEICRAAYGYGNGDGDGDGYGNGNGNGNGNGYGYGYGNGNGNGNGNGYGYGNGDGNGDGDGDGDGYGNGNGNGNYSPLPDFIHFEEKAA